MAVSGIVACHLPRCVLVVFAGYVVLWAVAVSGALVTGCGLVVENLTNGAVPRSWGALAQGLVAFAFIYCAGHANICAGFGNGRSVSAEGFGAWGCSVNEQTRFNPDR